MAAVLMFAGPAFAQIVPGTGRRVESFGDNFEDPEWSYVFNGKKSSFEQDNRVRFPKGRSKNGRWVESTKRGQPDHIKRINTPAGGLPGSRGALLMQSRDTGIPGRPSYRMQQDDLLARNYEVDVAESPSYVVRVYLPPYEQWENRQGSSFGFRVGARSNDQDRTAKQKRKGFFDLISLGEKDAYWPGMFIQFLSSHDGKHKKDAAVLVCRAGRTGREFPGLNLHPGWWTLGLSFTPDGAVHYYASEGVDRLTANDRIGSSFPYNYRAQKVTTMFFNICSADDTKTWSTPWVIDDPAMYLGAGGGAMFGAPVEEASGRGGFFKRLFR